MRTGKVIRFDDTKGYGFIAPSDGSQHVFVHADELADPDPRIIHGRRVEFDVQQGERGLKACNVRIIGGHSEPQAPSVLGDQIPGAFTEREFAREVTELIITAAPELTGATIVRLRCHLLRFASSNGWIESEPGAGQVQSG